MWGVCTAGMKYFTRLDLYKAGKNCEFNPKTCYGTSYGWCAIVKKIKGKVVFNSYSYSTSTTHHQRETRALLEKLGIKIDLEIEAPRGLDDLRAAIHNHESTINKLLTEINKKGSKKAKNVGRVAEINEIREKIEVLKKLIK